MAIENDIVLIYFEDKPMTFARIESILADSKPNCYHVKFLFLQVPLQVVTWILRDIYINGEEFTMNAKKIRIELVECPEDEKDDEKKQTQSDGATVISFDDLKKNKD